ncbi:MAG TPA: hypothetical protein VN873_04080 [Candidatus Angelobacter sp.]|nr:hypothetical protein [Candidatus Angelobacter sp.]
MNTSTPTQWLLQLTQTIITEQARSLVCIPDRDTAQVEREKLRREFRDGLVKADIRKDRTGKASTYTLRYVTRSVETIKLF